MSYYYNSNCNLSARNCASGCCRISGVCATRSFECFHRYNDYFSNSSKYYFPNDFNYTNTNTTIRTDVGAIAGGVVGGVIVLIIILVLVCWWKKKKAA